MIRVSGKTHNTIQDAAEHFGVSTRTVRTWIDTGVIRTPPKIDWGTRTIEVFPDHYLAAADRDLADRREAKRRSAPPDAKASR